MYNKIYRGSMLCRSSLSICNQNVDVICICCITDRYTLNTLQWQLFLWHVLVSMLVVNFFFFKEVSLEQSVSCICVYVAICQKSQENWFFLTKFVAAQNFQSHRVPQNEGNNKLAFKCIKRALYLSLQRPPLFCFYQRQKRHGLA